MTWLGPAPHADVVVTRNVESVAVWACFGADDPSADEGGDDKPTVKFPAMASRSSWLALQRHIKESEHLATHGPATGWPTASSSAR